jgi:hypothetical protein
MNAEQFHHLTQAIFNILAIFAGLLGGLWAYTKYVIERGLLPPIQFDIECKFVGYIEDSMILNIGIHLKNVGTATLVARWIPARCSLYKRTLGQRRYQRRYQRRCRKRFHEECIKARTPLISILPY